VILSDAHLTQCEYESSIHSEVATKAGASGKELEALRPRPFEAASEVRLSIVRSSRSSMTICLTDGISDHEWAAVADKLGTAAIVGALHLIDYYRLIAGWRTACGCSSNRIE
jgi:hypothetical protein